MKSSSYLALAGLVLTGSAMSAYAQDAAQGPAQMLQNLQARFQQQLDNASPEEKTQLLQMRDQFLEQVRQQGIDINDPAAIAQMVQARMGGAVGGVFGAGGGRGGRAGGGQGSVAGGLAMALTPEQKDAQRRQMMINAGITDIDTLRDVIDFLNAEDQTRVPLIRLARAAAASLDPRQLRIAVLSNLVSQNDQKVETAFNAYQNALAVDKVRHDAALGSLDASIGYSGSPRLEAFLTLVGVIDNDVLALGGATAVFGPAPPTNVTLGTPPANTTLQARNTDVISTIPVEGTNAAVAAPVAPAGANPFLN